MNPIIFAKGLAAIALLIAGWYVNSIISSAMRQREQQKQKERRRKHEQNAARIRREMEARKERMETGNSRTDFDNSLSVLSELAGGAKRNSPPASARSASKR